MTAEYEQNSLSQKWFGTSYTNQLLGLLPDGAAWVFDRFLLFAIVQDVLAGDEWQDTFTSSEEVQDVLEAQADGHLLTRLLSCFGEEFSRVESEAWRLVNSSDPGVATDIVG